MTERLSGPNEIDLTYVDRYGHDAVVTATHGFVAINGVVFPHELLRFLANLATSEDGHGYPRAHTMSQCYWADCPEHRCDYTMSHTRSFCGRPTCRET